jgi:hypothetical protein
MTHADPSGPYRPSLRSALGDGRARRDCAAAASASALVLALGSVAALAAVVPVASPDQLRAAIAAAAAGDEIVLAPGSYVLTGNINCAVAGSAQAPITVRAAQPGTAVLSFAAASGFTEGFRVSAPHWHFRGLDIVGSCASDDLCEHALHLFGAADATVIAGNRLRDFNAQVKSNGAMVDGTMLFPDDVVIEGNLFQDSRARNTGNPVTKIDVVGGRRWQVRANTLVDFQKAGGNGISYGAFLKGNSRDGVFERNLVRCQRDFAGGVRIGLSLGGGGTSPGSICEDGSCTPEHQGGSLRNNIVMDCSDVGIYLNSAAASQVHHNLLVATSGIDVRFPASSADLRNNLLAGQIRNRDGGSSTQAGNLVQVAATSLAAWFAQPARADFRRRDWRGLVDAGVAVPGVVGDFCGDGRPVGGHDVGALEAAPDRVCDTTTAGGGDDLGFFAGFEG